MLGHASGSWADPWFAAGRVCWSGADSRGASSCSASTAAMARARLALARQVMTRPETHMTVAAPADNAHPAQITVRLR
jgi:hypothetical protein